LVSNWLLPNPKTQEHFKNRDFTSRFFYGIIIDMSVHNDQEYVYESPDGGQTIYRRRKNQPTDTREMIQETMESHHVRQQRQNLWINIHQQARSDAELKELLNRAEVYYRLKYE
jgi:hypothetical protein